MNVFSKARNAWRTLRAATGDDTYERYLEHFREHHAAAGTPLSRREFCAREMDRKWDGVRRCC
jgi:uncharacterized short protein YbdD (DUF466 family)